MARTRATGAGWWGLPALLGLAGLTLGAGLGRAGRLSYHEAIVAQGVREWAAAPGGGAGWLVPVLDGRPWLEKPPLAHWLVALAGTVAGGVDEAVARVPSALMAAGLAVAVGVLGARRFGRGVGCLAAAVQLTTVWTVARGRLAEADIHLAALLTAALVAFDAARSPDRPTSRRSALLCGLLLGATALAKGVAFGVVLAGATMAVVLLWDRDRAAARRLAHPVVALTAALVALAWPLLVLARHPEALGLWVHHLADRVGGPSRSFASETWAEYLAAPLWQTLPWTPLALAGLARSARRATATAGAGAGRFGPDRLLVAWAVVPALLVSLASVRNAHYLLPALPPWSVWAALSLRRLGGRVDGRLGGGASRRAAVVLFGSLGVAVASGFVLLGPRLDRRGAEWAWYSRASRGLAPGEPLVLVYDDWDKAPYPTPFGPVPADLAVRLFYLDRTPAPRWHRDPTTLRAPAASFAAIARARDREALARLGVLTPLDASPPLRPDRTYELLRITPRAPAAPLP
jgi:4-amino-4-deoxy-L-arabinose transferase-like glycosyltransferase